MPQKSRCTNERAEGLKLANSPPHVRALLFAAIAAVREAEGRLAANDARIEALWEKTFAAQRAVEDAEAAIEKARQDQLEYLSSCDLPEPETTARQARQKRDEAEEALLGEDQQRSLENDLTWARSSLKDQVADVVRDDPSVRRLCERFRSFVDMGRAVEFLRLMRVLPDEHKFILSEDVWPDLPGERPWREAWAALERDADASLPE